MNPDAVFDPNFDPNVDCKFSNVSGTGVCSVLKTANYVYIQFNATASYSLTNPNAFPQGSTRYLYISRLRFPRTTTSQYPFFIYFRLFNSSSVNPTTYISAGDSNVIPRSGSVSGVTITQGGNVQTTSTLNYPAFVRL